MCLRLRLEEQPITFKTHILNDDGEKSFGRFWPLFGLYASVCFVKRTGPVHSVSFSCYLLFLWEYIFGCVPNNESATLLVFHVYIQMKAAILSKITKTSHSHIEQWTLDGSITTTIQKRVIFYIALIKEMVLSVYAWESMVCSR